MNWFGSARVLHMFTYQLILFIIFTRCFYSFLYCDSSAIEKYIDNKKYRTLLIFLVVMSSFNSLMMNFDDLLGIRNSRGGTCLHLIHFQTVKLKDAFAENIAKRIRINFNGKNRINQ